MRSSTVAESTTLSVVFRTEERVTLHEAEVVRILGAPPRVVLLANAYADGFSTHWPAGSKLVLDLFAEKWLAASEMDARLDESFAFVRAEFSERARALVRFEDDDVVGGPAAILFAMAVEPSRVVMRWIGGQQAILVRANTIVARTSPHTIEEKVRTERGDPQTIPHPIRRHLTRTISKLNDGLPPAGASFDLSRGDRVVLASQALDAVSVFEDAQGILAQMPVGRFDAVCVVALGGTP